MTIEQYRKKPVTIEAVQWTGSNLREVITFTDGPPDTRTQHAGMMWENYEDLVRRDGLKIFTLEGAMLASPGDWIIKGVKGEFYPCKPDIFAATYEPAALRREREPVKVKPLVWETDGSDALVADVYRIGINYGLTSHQFWLLYRDYAIATANDHDALKAAAQADYEARILAALIPVPALLTQERLV